MLTYKLVDFDGGHHRKGEIWIEEGKCLVCFHEGYVLAMDGSEEEYAAGYVCLVCIQKAFLEASNVNV